MKLKGKVWTGKECEGTISMYVSAEIRTVVKTTQKKVFRVRERREHSGTAILREFKGMLELTHIGLDNLLLNCQENFASLLLNAAVIKN